MQGNNEYSPPLVGGVRGGGELLLFFLGKFFTPPLSLLAKGGKRGVFWLQLRCTRNYDFRLKIVRLKL